MVRACMILAALLLLNLPANANEPGFPENHSTVHIVFVVPHVASPVPDATTPNAIIGNIVMPFDSIRPIAIHIDGKFVGNALFGHEKIKPIFVLPEGLHKFTFACDGLMTGKSELYVLGTGSTQYLIVKLPANNSDPDPAGGDHN